MTQAYSDPRRHRVNNIDSAWHGLYCTCSMTPCRYAPRPEPKVAINNTKSAAHWQMLPHDVRQYWRNRFQFDGPWDTVADMAYEYASAYRS